MEQWKLYGAIYGDQDPGTGMSEVRGTGGPYSSANVDASKLPPQPPVVVAEEAIPTTPPPKEKGDRWAPLSPDSLLTNLVCRGKTRALAFSVGIGQVRPPAAGRRLAIAEAVVQGEQDRAI